MMFGRIRLTGDLAQRAFTIEECHVTPEKALTALKPEDIQWTTTPIENADRLRVFNSIASGDVLGEVTIDFERESRSRQTWHTQVDRKVWASLFNHELPARVTRDGVAVCEGSLCGYYETGMEETAWTVISYKRTGFDGLHWLQNGDLLTIFNRVTDGQVVMEREVSLENKPYATGEKAIPIYSATMIDNLPPPLPISFVHTFHMPSHKKMDQLAMYGLPVQIIR